MPIYLYVNATLLDGKLVGINRQRTRSILAFELTLLSNQPIRLDTNAFRNRLASATPFWEYIAWVAIEVMASRLCSVYGVKVVVNPESLQNGPSYYTGLYTTSLCQVSRLAFSLILLYLPRPLYQSHQQLRMYLLLARITLPFHSKTTGAKLSKNAISAKILDAHWNPSREYILCAAKGKNPEIKFSRNASAATALPALLAYASVMYVTAHCTKTMMPKPMIPSPMLGIIQCTDGELDQAYQKSPPDRPMNDAGMLRMRRHSMIGVPGASLLRFAESTKSLFCQKHAATPRSSPINIADCVRPICAEVKA